MFVNNLTLTVCITTAYATWLCYGGRQCPCVNLRCYRRLCCYGWFVLPGNNTVLSSVVLSVDIPVVVSVDMSEDIGKLDMTLVECDSVVVAVKNNMLNSTPNSKIVLIHSFIKMGVPMTKINKNDATILIFSKYTHARYCIEQINKNSAKTEFIEFDSFGSEYIGYINTR